VEEERGRELCRRRRHPRGGEYPVRGAGRLTGRRRTRRRSTSRRRTTA
jgi:hypothetical protein